MFRMLVIVPMMTANGATFKDIHPDNLATVVSSATPGDIIKLKHGSYSNKNIHIAVSGEDSNPIIITGEDRVTFTGESRLTVTGSDGVVENLIFKDITLNDSPPKYAAIISIGDYTSGGEIRCTRCEFRSSAIYDPVLPTDPDNRYEFVKIIGSKNRLVDNVFKGRRHRAPVVHVWKTSSSSLKDSNVVSGNSFEDNHSNEPEMNGGEQVVIGSGTRSMSASEALIHGNTFSNVSGDAEVISVKSSGVTISENIIENSCGSITLRMGNGSMVRRNKIFGKGKESCQGYDGIIVSGRNHVIEENHIQKVKNGISLVKGEDGPQESQLKDYPAAYFQVENCVIQRNTILDVENGVDFVFHKNGAYEPNPSLTPKDITTKFNVIMEWSNYYNGFEQVINGISDANYTVSKVLLFVDRMKSPPSEVDTIYGSPLTPRY